MVAYATSDQLASRWHALDEDEESTAGELLEDAAVWLRIWFPGLDARIADGRIEARAAEMVSCAMVKRAMIASGREGQSSGMEVMGPFTSQAAFRNPEGNLYLTAQEVNLIEGNPPSAVSMECAGL